MLMIAVSYCLVEPDKMKFWTFNRASFHIIVQKHGSITLGLLLFCLGTV